MKRLPTLILVLLLIASQASWARPTPHQQEAKPNVVLIICDDLNDYVEGMDGHPQAHTPAMRELAASGVMFSHAYSNNPVCAPSRASLFTGLYSHTAQNLFWGDWQKNPIQSNSKTIMEMFRDNGYRVVGSGKTLHHHSNAVWDEYPYKADYGPVIWDGTQRVAHPAIPEPFRSIGAIDGSFGSLADVPYADDDDPETGWIYGDWVTPAKVFYYKSEADRSRTPDERVADWAVSRIEKFAEDGGDQSFFLSVGFIRPHTPMYAPQKYFDLFPLDKIELPKIRPDDVKDCGHLDVISPDRKGRKYFRLLKESYITLDQGLRAYVQAYLACVAATDDQVGRVISAIDNSRLRDNTIIIVTSDHGYNLGEKDWLFKNSPWEESTRIPLIIRAPGVTRPGGVAKHPVSLIDLYPTLIDLCGLQGPTVKNGRGRSLDGYSLRAFLEAPGSIRWDGPKGALTMIYSGDDHGLDLSKQHWSVRTQRWRYVLYNNGMTELYDHDHDPNEWVNLANDPAHAGTRQHLHQMLSERIEPDTRK